MAVMVLFQAVEAPDPLSDGLISVICNSRAQSFPGEFLLIKQPLDAQTPSMFYANVYKPRMLADITVCTALPTHIWFYFRLCPCLQLVCSAC
jgi:hypothetical protein